MATAVDTADARDRWPTGKVRAMRIRLGPAEPATVLDPLGRLELGYRPGLPVEDLWDRGRGVFKAQAAQVVASDLLLITAEGTIRMVGIIEGLTKHSDRIAIVGTPLAGHPLIGEPDPLANSSRNPVSYGQITLSEGGKLMSHPDGDLDRPSFEGFHRS